MNFSKQWLPSDKNVVGNSFVPRKVPSGPETSVLSSELKSNMGVKATEQKDLVHFDSAGFSKFFSRTEIPVQRDDELPIRLAKEAKETPEEVSRVMEALKLEETEINTETQNKQSQLFDSPDFVDDFDSLSRIFSNEKLEKPKVIPFLPNSVQNLAPCLSERTAIRKPSSFYDNQAQINRFYGSYQAPFYGSPQIPSLIPRTAGRSDQPESNRSWNTAENHNTSMTTAASHGHLEKVDFMHHRTDSADNNSFGSPFFPTTEQQYHHGQFQSPMMYGFSAHPKASTNRNGNFPMMQMPITEEEAYEGNGTSYYNGENSHQMSNAKHGQMTSFFDARQQQGHFDYHMQQQQQQQQIGQQGGKFLPIGGKKSEGKGNIYGKALAQRMKAKYGAGGAGGYEESGNIFDVDVRRIEACRKTTLMIKNIPNKYNLPLILEAIDKNHKGKYDFFYLPIDFRNNCNVGYAFINFSDTRFIKDFYEEFNGKKWDKFNSEKICDIKYARIQGRDALIQHFEYSSVMNQADKKLKPVILPKNDLTSIESLVQVQKAAIDENKAALC